MVFLTLSAEASYNCPIIYRRKNNMALIQCTECGHTVSDRAEICPGCGCPVKLILQEREALAEKEASLNQKFEEGRQQIESIHQIQCPKCGEMTSSRKIKCEHCGENIAIELFNTDQSPEPTYVTPQPRIKKIPSICCPRCGSTDFDLAPAGFSIGKAVAGGLLLGQIGMLAGASSSRKHKRICRKCGKEF